MPLGSDGYPDWYQGPKNTNQSDPGVLDWFRGFGRSALESIPEMIGINPSTETQQWRQDHPVGDVASEMLGLAVPYTGWFKAAKLITPLEKVAKGFEAGKGAFIGGALGTATRLAPLEAGRVAANEAVGDQPLDSMLGSAATDMALMSGIGGLLHGIGAGGTRDPKLPSIFPGLDVSLPTPLMARKMREIIDSGVITDPEMLGRANAKLKGALNDARTEEVPRSETYLGSLAHDSISPAGKTDDIEQQLNRLWRQSETSDKPRTTNILRSRKFAVGSNDFPSADEWKLAAQEAGLPDGFEEHGQYFRDISFRQLVDGQDPKTTEKIARNRATILNDVVTKNMQSVGDGNYLGREADEGMFVVARKYAGSTSKGTPDDKWVIFKTDKPGYFLPDADKWAKYQTELSKWVPNATLAPDAGPVYNSLVGFQDTFPLRNWMALAGAPPGKLRGMINSLLPQGITGPGNEIVSRVGDALEEYLTPRLDQFKKSFRANWLVKSAKATYDAADTTANELMVGKLKTDPGNGLAFEALRKGKSTGIDGLQPVQKLIDGASQETVDQFMDKVWRPRVNPAQLDALMTSGEITPETAKFAKALAAVKDWLNTTTQTVEKVTGRKQTEFHPGDYGLLRTWEGDTRINILNDSGQLVGQAAGTTRREAQKAAGKLVADNPGWKIGDEISISQDPAGISKLLGKGASYSDKQDLRGFKWDLDSPSKEDLTQEYDGQIRKALKYQANLSTSDILTGDFSKLNKEDSVAYRIALARWKDMAGIQSSFGKTQNKIVDQILGPVLGPNSASKIVGLTNTAMFDFTLGAMKLSYPVINALQAIQTVAPEIAFVMGKAVPSDLAPAYSHFAAGGTKGPIGGMAVLNPIKMLWRGLSEMRSPSADLSSAFERAANDRVIEPRMVEDYIGKSAAKLTDLRTAFSSGKDFVGWLRAMSEWLPAETERLSRTHAFTVGYQMARDFLRSPAGEKLSADQMYQFAREFTEKTMYLYGSADKARIFTTPAGSLMGLFKNWMFHYISSMANYTGQGLVKNNWAPLMWQMGGTMALGGLAATPFMAAADKFSKLWSDKNTMQLAYDQFGEQADHIMYGLPSYLGLAMNSSVDVPALNNPVRDGASLFSIAAWGRAQAMAKTVGAAFDNWQTTGRHPGTDQATRGALAQAFAPVTMYRAIEAFADPNAINSLSTGYPLVKDPSLTNRLLFASGFTPTELQRGYDVSTALYENHDALKTEEAKLSKAWAEAEMDGDSQRMSLIMRQGITWGVDVSRVIKGAMREIENQRRDIIERHLKPQDIGAWRRVIAGGQDEQ